MQVSVYFTGSRHGSRYRYMTVQHQMPRQFLHPTKQHGKNMVPDGQQAMQENTMQKMRENGMVVLPLTIRHCLISMENHWHP